ncbi:MAG: hypothetical protein RSA91_07850, partial [Bacilli bacterium]
MNNQNKYKFLSAKEIYQFALVSKGEDIRELADAIIASKDLYFICLFAKYVKGAPIDELADVVLVSKNAVYIYLFLSIVEGAPIDKFANALDTIHINENQIEKIADVLIESKKDISQFAQYVEGAPIDKLA